MAITADMVKKLREQTGAGMMDCKKALTDSNGDFDKAVTILREKGVATAAKREARAACEGLIGCYISEDSQIGVLVEVNCETTFVAKTDEFGALANNIASHIGHTSPDILPCGDVQCLVEQPYHEQPSRTVTDIINDTIAKLGEKTSVARFHRLDVGGHDHTTNGAIGSYIHMGSQIGVLVELTCETDEVASTDGIASLAKDVAMHISWSTPDYMTREEVPADVLETEKEVNRQWAIKEGKPEQILDRIVEGRLKEFYSRVCLMDQPFIKDEAKSIRSLLEDFSKDAGEDVKIARYVRFRVGETSCDA